MFNDIINTELRFWSVNTHTHVYVCVCVCVPITASQHTSGKSVRRNVPTSRLSVSSDTVLSTHMSVDNTVSLYTESREVGTFRRTDFPLVCCDAVIGTF